MKKFKLAWLAVLLALSFSPANAQLGGLLFGNRITSKDGEADGEYKKNNEIRTSITIAVDQGVDVPPFDDSTAVAYEKVITKAAQMAAGKDFAHFGVTKYTCSVWLLKEQSLAKSCKVIAVMLNEGEVAKQRGKQEVIYYVVDDVLNGVIKYPE